MSKGAIKERRGLKKDKEKNDTQRLDALMPCGWRSLKSTSCYTVDHDVPVHIGLLECEALTRTVLMKSMSEMLELETP